MTLKKMVKELLDTLKIDTSTSAVDRALSKMDISWKNVLTIPFDWNTTEVINKRAQYVADLNTQTHLFNRPKVYIDESGFNLHIRPSKGRALAGKNYF